MQRLAVASATLLIMLVACTGMAEEPTATSGGNGPSPDDATRPPPATVSASQSPPGGTNDGLSQDVIDRAIEQAVEDAGVGIDEVEVVTAESVTWTDGSIGCPEPGMAYTQALVPGYRVVLNVDGEEVHYHAAEAGEFFACANPVPPSSNSR